MAAPALAKPTLDRGVAPGVLAPGLKKPSCVVGGLPFGLLTGLLCTMAFRCEFCLETGLKLLLALGFFSTDKSIASSLRVLPLVPWPPSSDKPTMSKLWPIPAAEAAAKAEALDL